MSNEEQILKILGEMKTGLDELRAGQEELRAGQEELRAGQKALEVRVEKVEEYSRETRVLVEQQEKHIRLIAEQHGEIVARLERVERKMDRNEDLRGRVSALETVVKGHSAAIRELRNLQ